MKTTLEQLQDFQPDFTDIANRAERGRVETTENGQTVKKIFDGELRDLYEPAVDTLNELLDRYSAELASLAVGDLAMPTLEELAEYGT